jgi:hypothetical protein
MKKYMHKLTINVTPEQHMQIKVLASLSGSNIKNYVMSKVFGQKVASPRLLAAINEAKDTDSMTTYKTVAALFKKASSASLK